MTVAITHDGANVVAGDWDGQVLISKSEDPKTNQAIAANPPPAEQRLKEQTEKLAAFEPEFQESLAQSNALTAKLAEATKQRETLVAQRDKTAAEAKAAEDAAKAALEQADALATEIKKMTAATRDLHDLVIAARVSDLQAVEAQQLVADREAELGASLQQVAKMRRDQIAGRADSLAKQAEATRLRGEADAMQEPITKAEAAETEAKAASDAFAAQHADVVARKETLEKLVTQLRQAVE